MLHRHAACDQVFISFLRFNNFAKTTPVTHAYLSHLLLRTPVEVTQCFLTMMGRTWEVTLGKSSNQAQSMTNKKNPKNGKGCRNGMTKICKQGRDISAGKFTKPYSCIFMIGTVGRGCC